MNPLLDFPPEGAVTTAARTVIRFTGTRVCLDQETVEDIRHQLLDLADTPGAPELILDFDNIEYVASLALGMLVTLHKRLAAAGRRLTVCNLRPLVREVFATTRLDRLLNLQPGRRTGDAGPIHHPDDTPLGVLVVDAGSVEIELKSFRIGAGEFEGFGASKQIFPCMKQIWSQVLAVERGEGGAVAQVGGDCAD